MGKRRTPDRREMAAQLRGKPRDARDVVFAMRGDVPEALECDKTFFMLFQQWKQEGGREDSPLVNAMQARWAKVMEGRNEDARGRDPRTLGRGRFAGCLTAAACTG